MVAPARGSAAASPLRYALEPNLDVGEFRRVLVESGLSSIRPVDDVPRLQSMLSAAQLVVTARLDQPGQPLVGVARCITDFAWCAYLSDLAVVSAAQGLGVGKGIARCHARARRPRRGTHPVVGARGGGFLRACADGAHRRRVLVPASTPTVRDGPVTPGPS